MRIVLAVIIAFILMSIFVFVMSVAPWFFFGVDRVPQTGSFDAKPMLSIYSIVVAVIGALLAGWLAVLSDRPVPGECARPPSFCQCFWSVE